MLILVAGATGNIGQKLVDSLLGRGHQVRALAREISKLDVNLRNKLHSSVKSKNHYDIEALNGAYKSVDAVICAYAGIPELHLDGQLLLVRVLLNERALQVSSPPAGPMTGAT